MYMYVCMCVCVCVCAYVYKMMYVFCGNLKRNGRLMKISKLYREALREAKKKSPTITNHRHLFQDVTSNPRITHVSLSKNKTGAVSDLAKCCTLRLAEGVEPNIITHSSLISALATGHEWQKALHHLTTMRSAAVLPNRLSARLVKTRPKKKR